MAEGRYPQYVIAKIRHKLSLTDFISQYTSVDKYGKALCPFHDDTNPSLSITEGKGLWYCHACAKGGDIFTFLMLKENLKFPRAVKILGAIANVQTTI